MVSLEIYRLCERMCEKIPKSNINFGGLWFTLATTTQWTLFRRTNSRMQDLKRHVHHTTCHVCIHPLKLSLAAIYSASGFCSIYTSALHCWRVNQERYSVVWSPKKKKKKSQIFYGLWYFYVLLACLLCNICWCKDKVDKILKLS